MPEPTFSFSADLFPADDEPVAALDNELIDLGADYGEHYYGRDWNNTWFVTLTNEKVFERWIDAHGGVVEGPESPPAGDQAETATDSGADTGADSESSAATASDVKSKAGAGDTQAPATTAVQDNDDATATAPTSTASAGPDSSTGPDTPAKDMTGSPNTAEATDSADSAARGKKSGGKKTNSRRS